MARITQNIIAVANTGPIISAFQCDRMSVLEELFHAVHVSAFALAEYEKHGVGEDVKALIDSGFMRTHRLSPSEQRLALTLSQQIAVSPLSRDPVPASHLVDALTIVLAQRRALRAHYLLIDELAAREVAGNYSAPVMGFVGILRLAFEKRLLTAEEIEQSLRECQRQGTHYSNALIRRFVQSLQEESK